MWQPLSDLAITRRAPLGADHVVLLCDCAVHLVRFDGNVRASNLLSFVTVLRSCVGFVTVSLAHMSLQSLTTHGNVNVSTFNALLFITVNVHVAAKLSS